LFGFLKPFDRKFWNEEGYLHLKQVLTPEEVTKVLPRIDKVIERHVAASPWLQENSSINRLGKSSFRILKAIEKTNAIDKLIDHPNIFPFIVDLMGPYLQVMGTEIFVRHPNENFIAKFHTDCGPSMQNVFPIVEGMLLQCKIIIFLTDTSSQNSANFCLFPKSHFRKVSKTLPSCLIPEANQFIEKGEFPPGAIQLLAKPGDAIIFPWSLWHGVSPNLSSSIRRTIVIRYGQLWLRPRDYITLPSKILKRLTLRQKRLFGDFGETTIGKNHNYFPNDYYHPKDQIEIILGRKLEENSSSNGNFLNKDGEITPPLSYKISTA
jgi:ectoine hydroxylase-related dioxygenase (phytanoyl-CoA dioxygenase family)